jgi:hypothetical protein
MGEMKKPALAKSNKIIALDMDGTLISIVESRNDF